MLLDEIASRLITQNIASSSGSGSPAYYLYRGTVPDSSLLADRIVAVLEAGGLSQLPNLKIDRPTFQVLVRGARINSVSTAYEEARHKAETIKLDLHFLVGTTLSGVLYHGIIAEQEVFYLGEDMNQRPVFSCNYAVHKRSTAP